MSTVTFNPHARLLTMLGDQLIKNERIALVETIKNSYDADASWVRVAFNHFGPNFELTPQSSIVVEDDGSGMGEDVLKDHWTRPATPIKKVAKTSSDTTAKGRKIQGEKGIGRFALLKLGKTINIVTRPQGSKREFALSLDLSPYDDDFLHKNGKPTHDLSLSEIKLDFSEHTLPTIRTEKIALGVRTVTRAAHGTRIEVTNLRGTWTKDKVAEVYEDLVRLQSIFDARFLDADDDVTTISADFDITIYKDEHYEPFSTTYLRDLRQLIRDKPVVTITEGAYDEDKQLFRFKLNGEPQVLRIFDAEITSLKLFRDIFGEHGEILKERATGCGSFGFEFYVFDFNRDPNSKFYLDGQDRKILKAHRIYLYRDGIRVYPYGDPDDDWLRIDALRGTISAAWFLSNDQVVGHVDITQRGNPALHDKTNREGLIYIGTATDDFIHLLQVFLAWVRKAPYARYVAKVRQASIREIVRSNQVQESLTVLADTIGENKAARDALAAAEKLYKQERAYLLQRAETTEALAGVGLSVETAAHDIMSVLQRGLNALDALIADTLKEGDLSKDVIGRELAALRGMFSFVEAQLKDVQLLFKSTKQRRRDIRVVDVLNKVLKLFETTFAKDNIHVEVLRKGSSPLVAKTTDAVLLQLFLNLIDNSVYWLKGEEAPRLIEVLVDGDACRLIYSDSGPGIRPDDAPYIFEPFFSGRGEDGRGLGLYIAKQLLERQDYSIELLEHSPEQLLKGANFAVSFVSGDGK